MKNSLLFLLVVSACTAYAASTCETRVDSHQTATTRERVEYCLAEEQVAPEEVSGPELVYSKTYSNEPETTTPGKSTVKDGYFKRKNVSVRRQYIGSSNFPAFTNDTPSEQERAELAAAYGEGVIGEEQSLDAEEIKKISSQRAPSRLSEPAPERKVAVTAEQEARGLKARQEKPKRFMKQAASLGADAVISQTQFSQAAPQTTASQPQIQNGPSAYGQNTMPDAANEDDLLSDELGLEDELALPASIN